MSESGIRITVNGVEYVRVDALLPAPTQIVVAQRGWVYVGRVSVEGDDLVIRDAKNIRKWGTSRGLGELRNGPLPTTVADDYGTVRMPLLSVVSRIDAEGWQ
jgi:hypothetical protein